MAEIVKTVRIEASNGERTVKSLRKEISDLRDALLNMDKGGAEWKKTADELTKAQEELNTVMKAGKQAVDADATSIAGMEARYKSLYQTFRLLTQEQRKSAEGISMQKELAELSKNLNTVKKDAGNFKDNIGHYADDMMQAFGSLGLSIGGLQVPFKLASQGAGGLKNALNLLAKHPIITAIVVIIGLFKKLGDAIKGNEELQMRMNKVMAAFKPIGDAVAIILDRVAGLAVKVAEGIAKVVTWVTNLLGVTKKLSDAELALADSENALIKTRREIAELNSNDEARIQELLEEASITEDKVAKEKLLLEAKQLQEKVNERNIKLAEEELRIIKEKNRLTPSSTEELNKESEAQVKVNQARANGERSLRRINNQIKANANAAKSAGESERNELDKVLERLKKNSQTEIQQLTEKYEKEKKLLEKYHKDTTKLTEEYYRAIYNTQTQYEAARLNGARAVGQAAVDLMVQPSTQAFQKMEEIAAKDVMAYREKVEEILGEKEWPIKALERSKIFDENGELTKELSRLNTIFNMGIESGMDPADVLKRLNLQLEIYEKNLNSVIKERVDWGTQREAMQKELDLVKATFENVEYGGIATAEREYMQYRIEAAQKAFETVKGLNEEQLNTLGYTLNDQIELEKEYYQAKQELRDRDWQAQLAVREQEREIEEERVEALHDLKMTSLDSISTIVDTYANLIEAYKKDGKISKEEAEKKKKTLQALEAVQGAVAVASIVADTASAWMSVNKSLAAEYVLNAETAAATGPAAAATKAALDAKSLVVANIRKASLIVNGAAAAAAAIGKTISSIKALGGDSEDSGSGAGATAVPQLIDSTPYSYTRQLQTDIEREEMLNTPIYVRVTDIENVQARVRVTDREASF